MVMIGAVAKSTASVYSVLQSICKTPLVATILLATIWFCLLGLDYHLTANQAMAAGIRSQSEDFWRQQDGNQSDEQSDHREAKNKANDVDTELLQHLNIDEAEYHQLFKHAKKQVLSQLKQTWQKPEVSDQTRWVSYQDNFSTKRIVDFATNEIRITTIESNLEFQRAAKKFVRGQLRDVLSTSLAEAQQNDPVLTVVKHRLRLSDNPALLSSELVMSELFSSEQPSQQEIDRRTDQLFEKAYLRFREQLAVADENLASYLQNKVTYVVPMPKNRMMKKAQRYAPIVYQYAERMKVPPDIIFAIIHTESHFNPLARSEVPAFGLMQIVPSTAGRDATRHLNKIPRVLSPTYLFNPQKNVEIGVAYLNLVHFHYLKNIKKPLSRLYCTIAAYNTGTTNVAKAFVNQASMDKAAAVINQMSDEQVLRKLLSHLPQQETKDYVRKVIQRKRLYNSV